jgi:hypothetical protein
VKISMRPATSAGLRVTDSSSRHSSTLGGGAGRGGGLGHCGWGKGGRARRFTTGALAPRRLAASALHARCQPSGQACDTRQVCDTVDAAEPGVSPELPAPPSRRVLARTHAHAAALAAAGAAAASAEPQHAARLGGRGGAAAHRARVLVQHGLQLRRAARGHAAAAAAVARGRGRRGGRGGGRAGAAAGGAAAAVVGLLPDVVVAERVAAAERGLESRHAAAPRRAARAARRRAGAGAGTGAAARRRTAAAARRCAARLGRVSAAGAVGGRGPAAAQEAAQEGAAAGGFEFERVFVRAPVPPPPAVCSTHYQRPRARRPLATCKLAFLRPSGRLTAQRAPPTPQSSHPTQSRANPHAHTRTWGALNLHTSSHAHKHTHTHAHTHVRRRTRTHAHAHARAAARRTRLSPRRLSCAPQMSPTNPHILPSYSTLKKPSTQSNLSRSPPTTPDRA